MPTCQPILDIGPNALQLGLGIATLVIVYLNNHGTTKVAQQLSDAKTTLEATIIQNGTKSA